MSIFWLKVLLKLMFVPKHMYSLSGGLPGEAYCIEKDGDRWHFYYSERGEKRTIAYYDSEREVAKAFFKKIRECKR
jgi:hypothetical protein